MLEGPCSLLHICVNQSLHVDHARRSTALPKLALYGRGSSCLKGMAVRAEC